MRNIGTSRVNLTQRYVESVKYNGLGILPKNCVREADYRKRIEKIFSEIHMTGGDVCGSTARGIDGSLLAGEEMISRYYWAKRRDTDDIIWVRVDVRDCTAAGYGRFVCLLPITGMSRMRKP